MKTSREGPWSERILEVLDEIHARLDDESLEPGQLADTAGFSCHHFHRVFRGMTGESVMGLVRRLRLERAAQRLRFGDVSVTDAAFASGYQSHEAFTRAFRDRFGLAPRDFRAQARSDLEASVDARIEHLEGASVVGLHHVGPYEGCFDAWAQLLKWLHGMGWDDRVRASYGLVYDDPDVTAPDQLRYDACLALEGDVEPLLKNHPEH